MPFPPGGAEGERACEERAGGIMTKRAKPSGLYLTGIERYTETEDRSPIELISGRASVIPPQVAVQRRPPDAERPCNLGRRAAQLDELARMGNLALA